jgi:hypothetical protein
MSILRIAGTVVAAMSMVVSTLGQISHGGRAFGLMEHGPRLETPPVVQLPAVDAAALLAEDEERIASGKAAPYRFGFIHDVAIDMSAGIWTELENGDRIWRIQLHCSDAFSIGVVFSQYIVPQGGLVFLYNDAGEQHGAFMQAPRSRTTFAIDQVNSERITIEYLEPAAVRGQGVLQIGKVTHAYRDVEKILRGFGDSGDCNINVICPNGDGWRDQIRAVAMVNVGGGFCTGQLLNNCANDGTPYFLTADHCLGSPVENWIFTFNWDSPTCDPTENAPMDQTVSGSVLHANSGATDMAFLELDEAPPVDYEVFYSGWDKTATPATSVTAIHHPQGDIKKISKSFNPVVASTFSGADCWNVAVWDEGTTEQGSSGSGLWNQNKQLVGQLFGGAANCTNSVDDYYGRFDLSYPLLEQWLGSCGDTLGGYNSIEEPDTLVDAAVTSINNVPEHLCGDSLIQPQVSLKNNGIEVVTSIIVTYGVQGGIPETVIWTGSLQPGQTVNYTLPAIVVPPGDHILEVSSASPNGDMDQVPENDIWTYAFSVSWPSETVLLQITQDNYGADITWSLTSPMGVELYTGGPYQNGNNEDLIEVPFCLTNGCYTFTIEDVFGDGICCDSGEGSYTIQTSDSAHVFVMNNGEYGEGNTDVFCLEAVSVAEIDLSSAIDLSPNPTNGILNLRSAIALERVVVMDGVGRIISTRNLRGFDRNVTIDLSALAEGVYMLEMTAEGQRAVKRVVVQR